MAVVAMAVVAMTVIVMVVIVVAIAVVPGEPDPGETKLALWTAEQEPHLTRDGAPDRLTSRRSVSLDAVMSFRP
jgi:hypothetical protein